MRTKAFFGRFLVVSLFLSVASATQAEWKEIKVDEDLLTSLFGHRRVFETQDGRMAFRDDSGRIRIPGCSAGPQPLFGVEQEGAESWPLASSDAFSFFVDTDAVSSDLLLYLAGGGACWDAATCVGSALTTNPTYYATFLETMDSLDALSNDRDGSGSGGILTVSSENPYSNFAKVYVPYCTGDIHVGSSDTEYRYTLPIEFGGQKIDWTIHHRGFDNLLVVLKWLQNHYPARHPGRYAASGLDRVTVAGSSAGGYGALLNFPVIHSSLGKGPDYSIIVDASNGVLTDGFINRAFGSHWRNDGVWKARLNLDSIFIPVLKSSASTLWSNAFRAVGRRYRDTRISQSTTASDLVQAVVYLNMQLVDSGDYNPFVEPSEEVISDAVSQWSIQAWTLMETTAARLDNYRYYLASGSGHMHLITPPADLVWFTSPSYFDEQSAEGIFYTDWLSGMLSGSDGDDGDWRNLTCLPEECATPTE